MFIRSRPFGYSRTLFLSDLHLGAVGARSDRLLAFLRNHHADTYVLVGDILDLWRPLLPHWTAADQAVVDFLNARASQGGRLIFVPGNHDPDPSIAPLHAQLDATFARHFVHHSPTGARLLVVHGDVVDTRLLRSHLLTRLGSFADHTLRRLEARMRGLRRESKEEIRGVVEAALSWINACLYAGEAHERRLVALAARDGYDGVICGHFHIPALHDRHGLTYGNCGDWVDSCSAIAESETGALSLLSFDRYGKTRAYPLLALPLSGAQA